MCLVPPRLGSSSVKVKKHRLSLNLSLPLAESFGAHLGCGTSGVAPGQARTSLKGKLVPSIEDLLCAKALLHGRDTVKWTAPGSLKLKLDVDGEQSLLSARTERNRAGKGGPGKKEVFFLAVVSLQPSRAFDKGEGDLHE